MVKNTKLNIPIKDSLYLSPIEKYKYYGRFPWKLIIHILLVLGTSAQAILILSSTTQYTRSQERIFYDSFVSEVDRGELSFNRFTYLFTVEELKNSINKSIEVRLHIIIHNKILYQLEFLFTSK
jgi:hypothetical protein